MKTPCSPSRTPAEKIIDAASTIISKAGFAAATVRAVCERAEIASSKMYQTIGNIDQVMHVVAVYEWRRYVADQKEAHSPVSSLYDAIETLIRYGLEHTGLYLAATKPREGVVSELWSLQQEYLMERVRAVAKTGRLRVGEEQAVEVIQPFCAGMIVTCAHETSRPVNASWLSQQVVRPLLRPEEPGTIANQKAPAFASGLRANLGEVSVLSVGEQALLAELLQRIASS